MSLFDKTIGTLSTALDLYMVRHSIITDNIANAETPGFKSRRVQFESELQRVMDMEAEGQVVSDSQRDRMLASIDPMIYEDPEAEVGQDRNSVDMDREMAMMTKNDTKYSAATKMLAKRFAILKYAISEGTE